MTQHTVEQGDSLYSIAAKYRLPSWESLRDHPPNAELCQHRPHPQILQPGDVVEIPDATAGFAVALDRRTEFRQRPRDVQPLRLTLEHLDGTPMAALDFTLEHSGGTITGQTDGSGALEVELPIDAGTCKLTAGEYEWEIDVAHLNPIDETDDDGMSGSQGRLFNLGFFAGEIDGADSQALQDAIALFQVAHDLPRTATLDQTTRDRLQKRHGC
jgi:hypothetical protein